jgi:cyclophilin family peptidyl-prolyl cis-trans isomerase
MKKAIILLLVFTACGPKNEGPNTFSDEKLIHIYELQDRRDAKALLPLLKAKKESHRIAAAMAFASIQDTIAIPYLNQMLQIDQDPMPRRAAAYALGQIGSTKARGILIKAFDQELFPANRRYVMEAIGKCGDSSTIKLFEENEYQDSSLQLGWAYGAFRLALKGHSSEVLNDRMIKLLDDDNKDLAILASHYVYRYLKKSGDTARAVFMMTESRYDEVLARFYLLIDKQLSLKAEIETEVFGRPWQGVYKASNNYQRAVQITSLKREYTSAKKFLQTRISVDSFPIIIRNAAFSKFCEFYPNEKNAVILEALKSGDMAMQSLAAIEIKKQSITLNDIILKDEWEQRKELLDLLKQVKSQLKLPQQAETYIDICKAIEALGGEKFEGYKPPYNHPIDWAFIKTIPADQRVIIETNKGNITLQLFVEDAPGTTSNFLKLVDSNFYDGKYFHRVVPQFVIQGGCPRGDGWGSLDWTQRSEFSNYQNYETGTVGVASAGKDTEGVQFFITHCLTPHLDGRYSIFARVVSGMDVVSKMEIGDRMISIKRL